MPMTPRSATPRRISRKILRTRRNPKRTGSAGKQPIPSIPSPRVEARLPPPATASPSPAQSSSGPVALPSPSSSSSVQPLPLVENFPDVRENYYAAVAIRALSAAGVLGGYPDGTFKPRRSVNRAELLKIIMEGFHREEVRGGGNCFPDVRR